MNLICDFLIARAQPNNLCWMFSSNCTRSCGFRNSGIALFAISMLLGLEVLGVCNWLSACRKICIVSSANKPNNEIKTSSIFFPLWLVLKDKAHKLQVRHRLLYPRRLSWKNYCLFRSDVSCAHFLARTYVKTRPPSWCFFLQSGMHNSSNKCLLTLKVIEICRRKWPSEECLKLKNKGRNHFTVLRRLDFQITTSTSNKYCLPNRFNLLWYMIITGH